MTTDVTTLVLPSASISLTPTSPAVAAGGGGRVYRCQLLKTVATQRGEHVAEGTPVVRSNCRATVSFNRGAMHAVALCPPPHNFATSIPLCGRL
jgi:hypothetical protein